MSLELRPATSDDVERVSEIVASAYGKYVERLGRPPRPMTQDYAEVVRESEVTVAEDDGEIAGLVVLVDEGEDFLLDNVAVDPARHGTGVGRRLLEHAEARARDEGYDSLYLYTHETMTENLALYERIGYAEYERRRQAGGDEVVYMRKRLGGG